MADCGYPVLDPAAAVSVSEKLLELVRVRFDRELLPEQVEELRDRIAAHIAATEKLHAFPLTNADEPAFVLNLQAGTS